MPATDGAAMLVPFHLTYPVRLPLPRAELTATPTPTRSGESRPSTVGPRELKYAMSPLSWAAPTAKEFLAAA